MSDATMLISGVVNIDELNLLSKFSWFQFQLCNSLRAYEVTSCATIYKGQFEGCTVGLPQSEEDGKFFDFTI